MAVRGTFVEALLDVADGAAVGFSVPESYPLYMFFLVFFLVFEGVKRMEMSARGGLQHR